MDQAENVKLIQFIFKHGKLFVSGFRTFANKTFAIDECPIGEHPSTLCFIFNSLNVFI